MDCSVVVVLNKLLVATSNQGKIHEIRSLLSDSVVPLTFLSDFDNPPPDPFEFGATFAENAALKAREYALWSNLPTLADDSGLSVEALNGFPGVSSARWKAGSDQDRVSGLLSLMEERNLNNPRDRRAHFTCVLAVLLPGTTEPILFEGICFGSVASSSRGTNGFGYDPVFIPDGQTETLAQLGTTIKNQISARALAFAKLRVWLEKQTGN